MINMLVRQLSAKVRNLFSLGTLQKRYEDGTIQIKTHSGRVLEQKEAFPYGFAAKAKTGRVLVFCQGGNFDGFVILPLVADDAGNCPKLEEGDVALYTKSGGWVAVRENGTVELFGTDAGGIVKAAELKQQLNKLSARVDGIIDALKNAQTAVQDGGAAYKAQITSMLVALTNKEDFSNLENKKVVHGTGE